MDDDDDDEEYGVAGPDSGAPVDESRVEYLLGERDSARLVLGLGLGSGLG